MSVTQQQVVSLLENVLFESAAQAAVDAATWMVNPAASDISSLASAMADSGEARIASTVVGYYLTSLGRAPTAAEIGFYVGVAEQGLSQSQIAAGQVSGGTWNTIASYFSHSAEFASRAGLDYSLGVTGGLLEAVPFLYESVLGRTPSGAEISYYDNQIIGGTDLGVLFREFTASPEFHADTDAQIAAALAANGTAIASGKQAAGTIGSTVVLGPPQAPPPVVPPPAPTFGTLTTAVDIINDAAMAGPHSYDAILGAGATLNGGDHLTGNGLATLAITDTTAAGRDSLAGISLAGIETVTLTTAGNAGTDAAHPFDLSGDGALASVILAASGTLGDYVKVGSGVDLTIASASSAIGVTGSGSLTLTDSAVTSLTLAGNLSIGALTLNHDAVSVGAGTDGATVHLTVHGVGAAGTAASLPGLINAADGGAAGTAGGGSTVTLGNGNDVITIGDSGGVGGSGGSVDSNTDFLNGGTGGTGGDGGHDTVTLGDGNNSVTDNSAGGAGGVGGSVTGALEGLFSGGAGGNGGNGGHNSITVGNGDNTITDNSAGGAGGSGGGAGGSGGGAGGIGATGTAGTAGNDTITVGTGHNIIDLRGHGNDTVIVDTDAAYDSSAIAPNQIIQNAAAGDLIGFRNDAAPGNGTVPAVLSVSLATPDISGTVAPLPTNLQNDFLDCLAGINEAAGSGAFAAFFVLSNNTYIIEDTGKIFDAAHISVIEVTGVHNVGTQAGQIVLS